jgi:putative alpha-1,2-mannosidase
MKNQLCSKFILNITFFNSQEINSPFFTHQQLMAGGTLELVLTNTPNKEWGK